MESQGYGHISGFMGEGVLRRLPVYLLLDCSANMAGEPIIAVNDGLHTLYRELVNDPRAVETAWIGLITISGQASKYPLVPIDHFTPPQLNASGGTPMGAAFRALADSIQNELHPDSGSKKGDYAPLVFLLTGSEPTDEWRGQLARLKTFRSNQRATIVALGCGGGVNEAMLHEVTENVLLMQNTDAATLRSFFRWISVSVPRISHAISISGSGQDAGMAPPPPIPGIKYFPS